jgi:hypothetical protein
VWISCCVADFKVAGGLGAQCRTCVTLGTGADAWPREGGVSAT